MILYQGILDGIVSKSKEIIEEKLVGIYLHGSMAMGCFNSDKSDIDVIMVIEDDISDTQNNYAYKTDCIFKPTSSSKGIGN